MFTTIGDFTDDEGLWSDFEEVKEEPKEEEVCPWKMWQDRIDSQMDEINAKLRQMSKKPDYETLSDKII